jgi:coenzyme F420-0:L-glutamate ligase / coenzyme F420-1:gamma-L-glutamate ligase
MTEPEPSCGPRLEVVALPGIPIVQPGDDLAALIAAALVRAELALQAGDVLVVASKLVSRAEGRFVDLSTVEPSAKARELADVVGKDPRQIELVLRESAAVSRATRHVLIVRHRLGFVVANAGIDLSNAVPAGLPRESGPWAILLPSDPDAAAARLRDALAPALSVGVVISDSFGRPFRLGTVGAAIGVAGVPALWDQRGHTDLFGRPLENTITALADQLAATADLVAGQAAEGRGAVLIRGLQLPASTGDGAGALLRAAGEDLYA